MNDIYKKQVGLLIRIVPLVYNIDEFAVHGGTAINLFVKDMPRYSVDLDITYIPLRDREESITDINRLLRELKDKLKNPFRASKCSINLRYGNYFAPRKDQQ